MGRGRPKGSVNKEKDPFKDLSEDFKDNTAAMPSDELKKLVGKLALDQVALENAKEADEDLKNLQEQVTTAQQPYKEGFKQTKLSIRFIRRILKDRGESTPASLQEN